MPLGWECSAPCASSPGSWVMSTDDPIDQVTGSISDGEPVDWELAESTATDEQEKASLQALRDLERVALGHRILQGTQTPESGEHAESAGARGKLGHVQ